MLKVPTYQNINMANCCHRDMLCIYNFARAYDTFGNIMPCKFPCFFLKFYAFLISIRDIFKNSLHFCRSQFKLQKC